MERTFAYQPEYTESVFTGSLFGMLAVDLATAFVTGISFGLAYPWVLCWREKWFKEHTYINGRQLSFTGTGMQLLGNWLKWLLLTVVTFGIYALWLPLKIEQWTVKHTCLAEQMLFVPKEPETSVTEQLGNLIHTVKTHMVRLGQKLSAWLRGRMPAQSEQENSTLPGARTCGSGYYNAYDNSCCTKYDVRRQYERYCPACGARLPLNAKFCGMCAHAIRRN